MVNGPPTPPATTPVELQDEARANSSIQVLPTNPPSAPSTSSSLPEGYQNALILMADAISRKDYSTLVDISENTDINVRIRCCVRPLVLISNLMIRLQMIVSRRDY